MIATHETWHHGLRACPPSRGRALGSDLTVKIETAGADVGAQLASPGPKAATTVGECANQEPPPGEHNCEGELWQNNPAVNNLDCRLLGNVIASGNMGDELFEVVQVIH